MLDNVLSDRCIATEDSDQHGCSSRSESSLCKHISGTKAFTDTADLQSFLFLFLFIFEIGTSCVSHRDYPLNILSPNHSVATHPSVLVLCFLISRVFELYS